MSPMLRAAEGLARRAHWGQVDKVGDDYMFHVERVVGLVRGVGAADDTVAVAWLHDVLEDTALTVDDLRVAGISDPVIAAVEVLTRDRSLTYAAYIDAVMASGNPLALAVKRADLIDHLRPNCPASIRPRYERALAVLGA